MRRLLFEVQQIVQLQSSSLEEYDKAIKRQAKEGIDTATRSSGVETSAATPLGYDGVVIPQRRPTSHPLMSVMFLDTPPLRDRRQCPAIGITVHGPPGTPWDRSLLHMRFEASPDYPFRPPRICFCTGDFEDPRDADAVVVLRSVPFHPNVSRDGRMCIDIVDDTWNPARKISMVVAACIVLLTEVDEACVLNHQAQEVWEQGRTEWEAQAREYIEEEWRVD